MFVEMSTDSERLLDTVIQLVYFMRGSISYEEMMRRSYVERQRISNFIEARLESQKKSMYPVY